KAIGETIVLDACERGLDAVIVNPGSMIGPHDYEPSMIGAALINMYFGRVPVLLELLSDYVDVRDVADGMISAAEKGRRGERYFLTDMLRASVSNEVVSHDKARRELGYTIRTLRESLGDAVAWYREQGWLGA
ncbi:MAG: NAD-dependent epimerase/dehydratase family protein, partial [Polyangiales bacterium]